jgi:hypothetical protein
VVKEEETIELYNGKETGYRSKRLIFLEDTLLAPLYAMFGLVHECVVHYYGEWKKLVDLQPGFTEYRDMTIPHGHSDILEVLPVKGSYLNIKHGVRTPIFELLLARNSYKYRQNFVTNSTANTFNSNTGLATTVKDKTLAELQEENENLRIEVSEHRRQSAEDKAHGDMNEQIHMLDAAENEGFKDLVGEASDTIMEIIQGVVSLKHSWEGGLAYLKRNDNKLQTYLPIIIAICAFIAILAFIGLNPDLMNQLVAATQNPIVDVTAIAITALVVAGIYYYKKRRKNR